MAGLIDYLPALDYAILHQDIQDLDDAKTYIDMLARQGLMYHFDDGPFEIIWALPNGTTPTRDELIIMNGRQMQLYVDEQLVERDWSKDGGCPIGYALTCLRKYERLPA